jgi:hypothetical protein
MVSVTLTEICGGKAGASSGSGFVLFWNNSALVNHAANEKNSPMLWYP